MEEGRRFNPGRDYEVLPRNYNIEEVVQMSWMDPSSSADKQALARRQHRGERLHPNQVKEINDAIAAGDKDVKRASEGK